MYLMLCQYNISDDEFCNAIIHSGLHSDGQPLNMHTVYANEVDPAIIPCWTKKLNSSQLPANHQHNPALALLITSYETMEFFTIMPQSVDGLYNVTAFRYVNTSNTDYHIGFEYSMYMFDQSMDRTVAICGIRYYADGTNRQCLATTFTLIRYSSAEPPTTTSTAETTPTVYTTTTEATTPDVITTIERCNQTPDETTPSTTPPVPPETTPPVPSETVMVDSPGPLGSSGPLVTGLSLSTSILVLWVIILMLIIAILWVKLRIVSAALQKAMCNTRSNLDQSEMKINKKAVSDSKGENNEYYTNL